jgi:epoxyqueuosine reductase
MDLAAILRLRRDDFLNATRGTAIRRAGYPGFLRNAAIALGNSRDPKAIPALVEALDHPEPLVRGHVAWAFAPIGDPNAIGPLESRLGLEGEPPVREEIEWALAALSPADPRPRPRASS